MQMIDVLTQSPFLLELFLTKVTKIEERCLVSVAGKAWGLYIPDPTPLANVLYAGGKGRRQSLTQR